MFGKIARRVINYLKRPTNEYGDTNEIFLSNGLAHICITGHKDLNDDHTSWTLLENPLYEHIYIYILYIKYEQKIFPYVTNYIDQHRVSLKFCTNILHSCMQSRYNSQKMISLR